MDVNEELKYCENAKEKFGAGVRMVVNEELKLL